MDLPPGITPAQAAARARTLDRRADAHADPLPGPLAGAFLPPPAHPPIAGLTVRPMVHYDLAVLRAIDSPLIKLFAAAAKGDSKPAIAWKEEDAYCLIYILTRPPEESEALLARGPRIYTKTAMREIGQKLSILEVTALAARAEEAFSAAFTTKVDYGPAQAPDGTTQVFRSPAEMDSDGGSIISAGCTPNSGSPSTKSSTGCPASAAGPTTPGASKTMVSTPPNANPQDTSPSTSAA